MNDGEPPSCFSVGLRKARKEHHCCECPSPIVPGEIYEHSSGVWEGQGRSFKTCTPCAEFRQEFMEVLADADFEAVVIFGHLQSDYGDFFG